MNTEPPTSGSRLSRSSADATPWNGGHAKSFGKTVQSLPSSSGIDASPVATWRPWVKR